MLVELNGNKLTGYKLPMVTGKDSDFVKSKISLFGIENRYIGTLVENVIENEQHFVLQILPGLDVELKRDTVKIYGT